MVGNQSHKCVQTIEVQPKLKFIYRKRETTAWLKYRHRDLITGLPINILQEFQYGYNIVETTNNIPRHSIITIGDRIIMMKLVTSLYCAMVT